MAEWRLWSRWPAAAIKAQLDQARIARLNFDDVEASSVASNGSCSQRMTLGKFAFRIEARWRQGQFPNWWSRIGFALVSEHYQRKWHRHAHHRLSLLAHHGSTQGPRRDSTGLTHQGIDVTFTYHTKRRWFT